MNKDGTDREAFLRLVPAHLFRRADVKTITVLMARLADRGLAIAGALPSSDGQVDDIARALVGDVWRQLPGYDDDRMELDDLASVIIPNITALLLAVAERRTPQQEELTTAAEMGERRAIQGVPIEAVVTSWHKAEREVLFRIATLGPPLPAEEHRHVARQLATAIDALTAASTEAYRRTRTEVAAHLEQIATDLVSRLTGCGAPGPRGPSRTGHGW